MTTPDGGERATQAPTTPEAPGPPRAREPPAASGGRYVLDHEVGRGGMGRVYAGRDLRLGRPVAIRVLLDPDVALAGRFEREALVAARLQHPGIVTVYDAGFWPSGEPFLVMRLVPGRSLERSIADAETPAERIALLPHAIAAADALAYAHDQGIVHRDLKPSNIVVGAFGETVVIDWGLAKDLRSTDPEAAGVGAPVESTAVTRDGAVMGTPAYMPPEQAAGLPVDARADVYALGAILYQTLAGAPPSGAGGFVDGAHRPPAALMRMERDAPADLVAIVAKAMAFDRAGRYPSAFELAEDLKRFQTGQLVAARRYSPLARVARLAARHPFAVLAVAAAVAWLLGGR